MENKWMPYNEYLVYKEWEEEALGRFKQKMLWNMEDVKIPTFEERLRKAYEDVDEMNNRDKTGLSAVDIMKPYQWLNNLLLIKNEIEMNTENEKIRPYIEMKELVIAQMSNILNSPTGVEHYQINQLVERLELLKYFQKIIYGEQ